MNLPPLYHWSPHTRREAIRDGGLKPYRRSVDADPAEQWAMGHGCLCFGTDPAAAWILSAGREHTEIEEWDLWMLKAVLPEDEVKVRLEFGPQVKEVRIFNPIAGDRLWWVGTR